MSISDFRMQFRKPGYEQIMEIEEMTRSINATLLVAVFPMIIKPEEYEYIHIHREMLNFLDNKSIEHIDFLPVYNENDVLSLRVDDPEDIVHPNQEGHRLIAAAIHKKLGSIISR
jgi:lysophospholipase L1-like esterase